MAINKVVLMERVLTPSDRVVTVEEFERQIDDRLQREFDGGRVSVAIPKGLDWRMTKEIIHRYKLQEWNPYVYQNYIVFE